MAKRTPVFNKAMLMHLSLSGKVSWCLSTQSVRIWFLCFRNAVVSRSVVISVNAGMKPNSSSKTFSGHWRSTRVAFVNNKLPTTRTKQTSKRNAVRFLSCKPEFGDLERGVSSHSIAPDDSAFIIYSASDDEIHRQICEMGISPNTSLAAPLR